MRTVVALAAVALLIQPSEAGRFLGNDCLKARQPPESAWHEPTVPYDLFNVSRDRLNRLCARPERDVTACAYQATKTLKWTIVISDDLNLDQYACVVRYEKSHLPPNYWGDPAIEYPETIEMLKALKKADR